MHVLQDVRVQLRDFPVRPEEERDEEVLAVFSRASPSGHSHATSLHQLLGIRLQATVGEVKEVWRIALRDVARQGDLLAPVPQNSI